jgi:hypothetical protein
VRENEQQTERQERWNELRDQPVFERRPVGSVVEVDTWLDQIAGDQADTAGKNPKSDNREKGGCNALAEALLEFLDQASEAEGPPLSPRTHPANISTEWRHSGDGWSREAHAAPPRKFWVSAEALRIFRVTLSRFSEGKFKLRHDPF